jgi:flagellar motor switch/type III secretory pathway protein FliN
VNDLASPAAIPLLLLGDTGRRHLAERLTSCVERWRDAWLPGYAGSANVEVHDPRSQPVDIRVHEDEGFRVRAGVGAPLVLIASPRAIHELMGVCTHGPATYMRDDSPLAAALELETVRGLAAALLRGSTGLEVERAQQTATELFRTCEGARYIRAVIHLGEHRCVFSVLLTPAFAESLLPPRAVTPLGESLESRRSAIGSESIAVDAVLGTADVPVADLAALAVGDVIVLNQGLADGAELAVRGGKRIGGAALGCIDGKRAIQINERMA